MDSFLVGRNGSCGYWIGVADDSLENGHVRAELLWAELSQSRLGGLITCKRDGVKYFDSFAEAYDAIQNSIRDHGGQA